MELNERYFLWSLSEWWLILFPTSVSIKITQNQQTLAYFGHACKQTYTHTRATACVCSIIYQMATQENATVVNTHTTPCYWLSSRKRQFYNHMCYQLNIFTCVKQLQTAGRFSFFFNPCKLFKFVHFLCSLISTKCYSKRWRYRHCLLPSQIHSTMSIIIERYLNKMMACTHIQFAHSSLLSYFSYNSSSILASHWSKLNVARLLIDYVKYKQQYYAISLHRNVIRTKTYSNEHNFYTNEVV